MLPAPQRSSEMSFEPWSLISEYYADLSLGPICLVPLSLGGIFTSSGLPPISCIVSEVGGVYWIHCPTTPPVRTLSREDTLAFFDLGSHTLLSMTLSFCGGRFQKLFIWDPYSSILLLIPPPPYLFSSTSLPNPCLQNLLKNICPPPAFKYIVFTFLFF